MAASGRVSRVSFAGGELARRAAARDDFARYEISMERVENMIVMQEGGLTRAPGTRFILEAKDGTKPTKHIPFRFDVDDYYTIIVNGGKARLVKNGGFVQVSGTPYEFPVGTLPWSDDELPALRTARQGNDLYVVSGQRAPYVITRNDHTDWTVAAYAPENGPVQDQNLDEAITVQASAATGAGITLTGVGNPFKADMVGGVMRLDDPNLAAVPEWAATELAATLTIGQFRRWNGNVYQVTVAGDAGPNPPVHTEGSVSAGNGKATWLYAYSDHGYVRIKTFTNTNSVTADVLLRLPASIVSTATFRWYAPAWTDTEGWPSYISFYKRRLGFYRKDRSWLTALDSATDHDLGTGEDDEAIQLRIVSPQSERVDIQFAMPAGVLMLGTADVEWVLRGDQVADRLTPKETRADDATTNGSAALEPARVDSGVIWIGGTKKRLHFAKYLRDEQRLDERELSQFARHLFKQNLAGICWQRDPHRILWMWFVDGSVAALTYVPSQEILAFTRRPFVNGFVEQMSCVPSPTSGTDEVILTVRREIAGQSKLYIEQMADFFDATDEDNPTADGAWFLDCAAPFEGVGVTRVTGLGYLRGQTVGVFADGAMQNDKLVDDLGGVDLDRPSNKGVVGIKQRVYGRDLPRNFNSAAGSTRGQPKNIHSATIQVHETGGLQARVYNPERGRNGVPDRGEWDDLIKTGAIDYASAPPLFTGVRKIPLTGSSREEAQLEFRATHALPVTILALSPRITLEGDT